MYYFADSRSIEFFADGRVVEYEYGEWGRWSADGNRLRVVGEWSGTEDFTFSISGDQLTITDRDGDRIVFRRSGSSGGGGGGAPPVSPGASQLIGGWELVSGDWIYYFADSRYVEFFSDGTVYEDDYGEGGRWSADGNRLRVVGEWSGAEDFTFSISGNSLTITDRDGDRAVYRRSGSSGM